MYSNQLCYNEINADGLSDGSKIGVQGSSLF